MLPLLYKSLFHPVLEYANAVWGPKDKKMIEKVQKRATHMISSLKNLPYKERLRALNLPSLYYCCKRGDMILIYQIFHGLVNVNPLTFFHLLLWMPSVITTSRFSSHILVLIQIKSWFFSNRIISDWNSLPSAIVKCFYN